MASCGPGSRPPHHRREGQHERKEGQRSLEWTGEFVRAEQIDCDFGVVGRFHAAHNAAQFEALAKKVQNQPKGLEVEAHVVPRSEQKSEIDTDTYFGGVIYARHASIDPARYHQGLLERARASGADVITRCPVTAIENDGARFRVTTARGTTSARDVVIATDGYTGPLTPWLQRRVIPIGSYVIATEPMPEAVVAKLIPRNRIVSDTRGLASRGSPRAVQEARIGKQTTPPCHNILCQVLVDEGSSLIGHLVFQDVVDDLDELAG